MAQTSPKSGKILTLTAPAGGVTSGTCYKVGQLHAVAAADAAQATPFEGLTEGEFTLPKAAGVVPAEGALAYWNAAAGNVVAAAGVGIARLGTFTAAGLAGDATCRVKLSGQAAPDNVA